MASAEASVPSAWTMSGPSCWSMVRTRACSSVAVIVERLEGLRRLRRRDQLVDALHRGAQILDQLGQRQRRQLGQHAADRRGQGVDLRGHRGDLRIFAIPAQLGGRGRRMEAEIDQQLAGQEVARLQLRAQAALDQLLHQHIGGAFDRDCPRAVDAGELDALGLDLDGHRDADALGRDVDLQAHVADRADPHAPELDRRAGAEAADRFVELDDVGHLGGKARLGDALDSCRTGRTRCLPGWACPALALIGVSKAMPPVSSACTDSVATCTPFALIETRNPLAFQKRLSSCTS